MEPAEQSAAASDSEEVSPEQAREALAGVQEFLRTEITRLRAKEAVFAATERLDHVFANIPAFEKRVQELQAEIDTLTQQRAELERLHAARRQELEQATQRHQQEATRMAEKLRAEVAEAQEAHAKLGPMQQELARTQQELHDTRRGLTLAREAWEEERQKAQAFFDGIQRKIQDAQRRWQQYQAIAAAPMPGSEGAV